MRVIAFTALAALVATVLVFGAGCGEDGEETVAAPAPTTVAQPAPAPTPVAPEAGKTKAPQKAKAGKPPAEPQPAGAADAVEAVCPPKLTKAQCRELGRAAKEVGPSHIVKSGRCPPSLTREECRELAAALKQVGPSHFTKPGQCVPPLTQADCEAAARADGA